MIEKLTLCGGFLLDFRNRYSHDNSKCCYCEVSDCDVLCGSNANECIIYNDGTNSRWLVWTNANCIFPLLGV